MPTRHAADAHRRRMRFVTPAFEHAHASPAEDLQTMRRSALITFPIMASVFMGGGVIGFGLTAALTATGSVSRLLGLCSLPPAFIIGAMLCLAMRQSDRGRICSSAADCLFATSGAVPSGSVAFVLTSMIISTFLGVVVALAPSRPGFLPTPAVFIAPGAGYGIVYHLLARNGILACLRHGRGIGGGSIQMMAQPEFRVFPLSVG
ncbi:hypothetical protein [Chloroflexus sp.]|uniref:hypothetical protein n=1 Tax=Chloroflexus sp. TaxID=1904827 RepID=UPI00404B4A78